MLLGYDDEDDFYGFNTEEIYTGALVFSTITDGRSDTGDFHDDFSGVSYIEYDSRDVIEHEDDFNIDDIPFSGDVTLGDYEEGPLDIIEIDVIPLDTLPEIRLTEEEFVELAQHMDEHFDFEDEMDREQWDEQFEDFEEPEEQREEIEEQYGKGTLNACVKKAMSKGKKHSKCDKFCNRGALVEENATHHAGISSRLNDREFVASRNVNHESTSNTLDGTLSSKCT